MNSLRDTASGYRIYCKKIALELNIGLFIQKQNKKMIVKVTEV